VDQRLVRFFIHQVIVGHCWLVIVQYYELSFPTTKIVLLKNKGIVFFVFVFLEKTARIHVVKIFWIAKFKDNFCYPPKTGHFASAGVLRPDTLLLIRPKTGQFATLYLTGVFRSVSQTFQAHTEIVVPQIRLLQAPYTS
jgi:hypothetical protein